MAPDFETVPTGTHKALSEKDLEIAKLRELVRMGRRVVNDFLPNIGRCALQNYGEMNEFMLASEPYKGDDQ